MKQLNTRSRVATLTHTQARPGPDSRSRTKRSLPSHATPIDDKRRRTLVLLPAAPSPSPCLAAPTATTITTNHEPPNAAPSAAFLAALQCDGESDVRGHLFQFLQLADIVRLSSLSRAWRALGVERDVRSVCASLPPHMEPLHGVVSEAALGRFLCKVCGFTAFLSRCSNLRTVQVAMSDFYLHPDVDKALTKLFECLGRMGRLRILSLMNYSHNRDCEERFFNVFFNYLLSVRRGSRVFRQLDELCLRMGNNRSIKNVHRLFSAARRHAFGRLRSLTLDYQGLGPCVSRGVVYGNGQVGGPIGGMNQNIPPMNNAGPDVLANPHAVPNHLHQPEPPHVNRGLEGMLPWTRAAEAGPEEDDVAGCLESLPRLENLKIHGPGAGNFLEGLARAPCRYTLRHLDVQGGSASDPSYVHLAHALCDDDEDDEQAEADVVASAAAAAAAGGGCGGGAWVRGGFVKAPHRLAPSSSSSSMASSSSSSLPTSSSSSSLPTSSSSSSLSSSSSSSPATPTWSPAHSRAGESDDDAVATNAPTLRAPPATACASLHTYTHAHTSSSSTPPSSSTCDLPALRSLRVDASGLWTLMPALQKGKCAKLAHLRVLLPHRDITRPMCFPTPAPLSPVSAHTPHTHAHTLMALLAHQHTHTHAHTHTFSPPTTSCISSLHHLLSGRLAPLLADSHKLTNLAHLKITLGRQQVWGLIRDRSAAEQMLQSARAGGRAKSLIMELQEAFIPASVSRAPITFSCSRPGCSHHHHHHHHHGAKHTHHTRTTSSPPPPPPAAAAAVPAAVATHNHHTHSHTTAAAAALAAGPAAAASLVDMAQPPPVIGAGAAGAAVIGGNGGDVGAALAVAPQGGGGMMLHGGGGGGNGGSGPHGMAQMGGDGGGNDGMHV